MQPTISLNYGYLSKSIEIVTQQRYKMSEKLICATRNVTFGITCI